MRTTETAEQMAARILTLAREQGLAPGARLVEQKLAAVIGVSRGPVRAGLQALAEHGMVARLPNRGCVLAAGALSPTATHLVAETGASEAAYRAIARDRIAGGLPDVITEAELSRRYKIGGAALLRLLDRISGEGWLQRLSGYGWKFSEVMTSPEVHRQSMAFRILIETAALAEPGYHLAAADIAQLRAQQQRMLDGGLTTLTLGEIFEVGSSFHEQVVRGAGNPFYLDAWRRISAIRRLFSYHTISDVVRMRRHIKEHLLLLDLIAAGDTAAAVAAMRRHLKSVPKLPIAG
jgi:DNA-binding GntR family transcriptional regulator